ncbi:hypothetical protein [Jiulongibacter sediminis]|uniref:hypothetical protein n=1 Tax=Jiulongibacter sediminis TaxID=1605367 RepID=UPI00103BD2E9|nr:hypothetical protein [Jiulongibacter sediminis]
MKFALIYQLVLYGSMVAGILFRKSIFPSSRYIFYLILITSVVETIGLFSLKLYDKPASVIYDFFQPIELILIGLYFLGKYQEQVNKVLSKVLVGIGILFLIAYHIIREFYELKAYYDFLIVAFIVSILSILFLIEVLRYHLDKELLKYEVFWISTGILVFHAGSFVLMGTVVYVYLLNPKLASQLYSINHLLNIIYYSLITYAFYIQWKSTKSSSSSLEGH